MEMPAQPETGLRFASIPRIAKMEAGAQPPIHPLLRIQPPLVNSSNPWASSYSDLLSLWKCPFTGAVTTRTSMLEGFADDPSIHQHTFFDTASLGAAPQPPPDGAEQGDKKSSLNTYGYSPHALSQYLEWIEDIVQSFPGIEKPWIVSVTGTPEEVAECYRTISQTRARTSIDFFMEVNLSCPNITGKSPPAYSGKALDEYLRMLGSVKGSIPIGLKLPPYTYKEQFTTVVPALEGCCERRGGGVLIDFLTSTNTLGACFVPDAQGANALASADSTGIGGLAGAALHPLALGNVKTLAALIEASVSLRGRMTIVGVGGVDSGEAYERMRKVGAGIVGVGTAFGREGLPIFEKIAKSAKLDAGKAVQGNHERETK